MQVPESCRTTSAQSASSKAMGSLRGTPRNVLLNQVVLEGHHLFISAFPICVLAGDLKQQVATDRVGVGIGPEKTLRSGSVQKGLNATVQQNAIKTPDDPCDFHKSATGDSFLLDTVNAVMNSKAWTGNSVVTLAARASMSCHGTDRA